MKATGFSRPKISRLENGKTQLPKHADIAKILTALGVEGDERSRLTELAIAAGNAGWWTSYGPAMGVRQALYADLESGASTIKEYQPFVPGLLQTTTFAEHVHEAGKRQGPVAFQTEQAVEARRTRQTMLLRPNGPTYQVVIDEIALRRLAAPPSVVADQLRHIVDITANPRVSVRILLIAAPIDFVTVRAAFSMYSYPDPLDPQVVAVDTVTSDLVLTTLHEDDAAQVGRYSAQYQRLVDAALSEDDSTQFLNQVAEELRQGGGAP
jgi:hypothetical protein